MKKILLFTDIPPCQNYSGGLVLRQLCSFLPEGSIDIIAVMNPQLNPDIPADLKWIPLTIIDKPRERWGDLRLRILNETISVVMDSYSSSFLENKIISKTMEIAKKVKPDAIWLILEGHTFIRMGYKIVTRLKIPTYSFVWDPPGWWLRENKVNVFTSKRTIHRFNELLRLSTKTATASWALADKYKELGANTIPVVASIEKELVRPPAISPGKESDEFIIAIAGQIYATSEWETLILALNVLNWQIAGKKAKIRVLSRYVTMWSNASANIEFLGWRSQVETIALLAESDILFCPYWFRPDFAIEAQLSYPSKLTTYFAAGRPVLFLGPSYSSPATLIEKYNLGLGCYSLNVADVVDSINRIALDQDLCSTLTANAHKFVLENLTTEVLKDRFFEFLDFEE